MWVGEEILVDPRTAEPDVFLEKVASIRERATPTIQAIVAHLSFIAVLAQYRLSCSVLHGFKQMSKLFFGSFTFEFLPNEMLPNCEATTGVKETSHR
jgi:hypothetical protein